MGRHVMVPEAPTARPTSQTVHLLRVVAACESELERLDGRKNPALVARATSVRLTRASALLRLAEIRTARSAAEEQDKCLSVLVSRADGSL